MVKEVERRIRVTDGIIKFITVRVDEELKKAERRKAKRNPPIWAGGIREGKFTGGTFVWHRRGIGNPGAPLDRVAAHELYLYTVNDGDLYRGPTAAIVKMLAKHARAGKYDRARAVKAWGYLAEIAAKKYAREHAGGSDWSRIFSPATRRASCTISRPSRRFASGWWSRT